METIRRIDQESRQGIALIVVVGMLALMMIMAVAFAIFMRTERVAAGSFKNDIRVKSLLQVSLSRAVNAIDAYMIATNLIYPPFEILPSTGANYAKEALTKSMLEHIPFGALTPQGACLGSSVPISDFVGSNNIPGVAKGAVVNMTDRSFGMVTNIVDLKMGGLYRVEHTQLFGGTRNTWQVNDQYYFLQPGMTDAPQGGGRFGYVVINCSGLLDANNVGGMARGVGTNVMEINLQSMPDGVDTNKLVTQRQSENFETHQELLTYSKANRVFNNNPENFISYSSSATNDGRIYIGGTVAELLARRTEIIGALTNLTCQDSTTPSASFLLLEAETLFTNLIDFVDSDNIPGNLGNPASPGNPSGPFVERVPMANEIVVTNQIVFSLDTSNPAATNYFMKGTSSISVEFMTPIISQISMGGFSWLFALESTSGDARLNPLIGGAFTNASFGNQITPYLVKTMKLDMVGDPVAKPIDLTSITKTYNARVMTQYGGNIVDAVTNMGVPLKVTVSISPSGGLNSMGIQTQYVGIGVAGIECIDPRLNGDTNNWMSRSMTLGSPNYAALLYLNPYVLPGSRPAEKSNLGPPSQGKDGDTVMYVANAQLNSVGDMGYLFYGHIASNAWETVRLFKIGPANGYGQMHAVLDHFTTDNYANGLPKGRVNPNTRNRDVLNAVFENMPQNKRHASSGASVVNAAQVRDALMNRSVINEFNSLAELGAIRWDSVFPLMNSLDRESIIRNSAGLFDVRQNLFLILLYADVTKTDLTGNTAALSTVMGVAEVWRDPLDVINHYPVSIHSFQVIESP